MNFSTKITIKSTSCEGVTFTINRLTEGKRIEIVKRLIDANERIEKLRVLSAEKLQELKPYMADIEKSKESINSVTLTESIIIQEKVQRIESDLIIPVYVDELLVDVNGLTIDGLNADKENAVLNGPKELYQEIVEAINKERGLSGEESGNSESPSISTAQVDGQTNPTSAETADAVVTT